MYFLVLIVDLESVSFDFALVLKYELVAQVGGVISFSYYLGRVEVILPFGGIKTTADRKIIRLIGIYSCLANVPKLLF